MSKKKLSFEQALEQLETIAEQIEQGKIGLEESITKYEEGMGLVKQCRDILSKAEMKIQKLQERADGTLETARFTKPKS
jgi:exodeoxyribonuclease VII small subunit